MVRFCRSTCEVQILAGSGFPLITIGIASTTSAGEYLCSPSRGAALELHVTRRCNLVVH
jgi:hypothetical protein